MITIIRQETILHLGYKHVNWSLKTRKLLFPPTPNLKFELPPTRNPNASQWNIGCVGSQTQNLCVSHLHVFFGVLISFALGSQREPRFQLNMGFNLNVTSVILRVGSRIPASAWKAMDGELRPCHFYSNT